MNDHFDKNKKSVLGLSILVLGDQEPKKEDERQAEPHTRRKDRKNRSKAKTRPSRLSRQKAYQKNRVRGLFGEGE